MKSNALIIEDSPSVRRRIRQILEDRGLFGEILEADDGLDGFKLLIENDVDLVLCDINMPKFDGFKFLNMKATKREFQEIPVIVITSTTEVETKVRGLEAGATDYVTKPFNEEELVARVKVHLKIKNLQDELREKNAQLKELSITDALTKAYNRRYFMDILEIEFSRAERYQSPLSLLMFDLDHFKQINDLYGHLRGDAVLVGACGIIRQGLRQSDILARYGGEEFSVLLPETDLAGAARLAERIRRDVEQADLLEAEESQETGQAVTLSAGVACLTRGDEFSNPDALIKAADDALYQAKKDGRNRVAKAS